MEKDGFDVMFFSLSLCQAAVVSCCLGYCTLDIEKNRRFRAAPKDCPFTSN